MRKIERIFVHCTAGPQTQTVEEIQKYWKNHNKWTNPGYHYIIKPNGEIVPLQPEDKPSNGVAGYNSTSINVCYIGGVDKAGKPVDNRTWEQKESLAYILKDLHSRYPDAEILGHRDIWGSNPKNWHKQCPCFDIKTWWNEVLAENTQPEEPIEDPEPITQVESEEEVIEVQEPEPVIPQEPQKKPNIIDFIVKLILKLFGK